MDRNWSKVVSPEEATTIPPLPTRDEEIAYLDKLEFELRHQSYYKSGFHPDPIRKYELKVDEVERAFYARRMRKMSLTAVLFSPVALWLAEKSPAKACSMGIPYRSYPEQHKIRFWAFFLAYDLAFTIGFYYFTLNEAIVEEQRYPLNTLRERKL